jgi:hypothetical protein
LLWHVWWLLSGVSGQSAASVVGQIICNDTEAEAFSVLPLLVLDGV